MSAKMIEIDGEKLRAAISEHGINGKTAEKALGVADNYLTVACSRGRIAKYVMVWLTDKYGITRESLAHGEEKPVEDTRKIEHRMDRIEELIKVVANSNHDIYEGIEALNALLTKMLEAQEKSFCIQKKQYDAFVNFTKFGRVS